MKSGLTTRFSGSLILIFPLLLTMAAFTPFASQAEARSGGSSDGTGNFFYGTEKQVLDAAREAHLRLMIAIMDFQERGEKGADHYGNIVPPELIFVTSPAYLSAITRTNLDPGIQLPDSIPTEWRKKGACDGPDGAKGAGSVITQNGKPKLCLSIQRLRGIPTDYLVEEISILLAHESAHLIGKDESFAQKVQTWFSAYSKIRLELASFAAFSKDKVPGSGFVLKSELQVLSQGPTSDICKRDSWGDSLVDVDHAMRDLRYKFEYFKIKFPDPNQSEYWSRKALIPCGPNTPVAETRKAFEQYKHEYDEFIDQFGFILPFEIYR